MRLIDADELKKAYFNAINETSIGKVSIIDIIDNAPTVERPQGKWFDCIAEGTLKARHGDYVLYKVDYLLDNLTREVYIMEGARKMRGKNK